MKPRHIQASRRAQGGASLLIALVALVSLTYTGLALVRTSDTGSLVAGNFAFRQAALNAADMGIEQAIASLETRFGFSDSAAKLDTSTSSASSSTDPVFYYAFSSDAGKIETSNNTSTNGTWDWPSGKSRRINWDNDSIYKKEMTIGGFSGFTSQSVVERMCSSSGGSAIHVSGATGNVNFNCQTVALASVDMGQSRDPLLAASVVYVAYRVTVKVTGPRNTAATVQALIAKQQPPG